MRQHPVPLLFLALGSCALMMSCSDPSSPTEGTAGSSASGGVSSAGTAGSPQSGSGGTTPLAGASTGGAAGGAGANGGGGSGPLPELAAGRIAAADEFACAIDATDTVICWGFDADWSATEPRNKMQKSVTAGGRSRCSMSSGGIVFCRGDLGNAPVPGRDFAEIVVSSDDHACTRSKVGTMACWARAGESEWAVPSGTFTQLAAGDGFACGIRQSGGVECWGPSAPAAVPDGTPKRLFARAGQACFIKPDDTVACWGDGPNVTTDVRVSTLAMGKSMGGNYVCGIKLDGIVVCWGDEPSVVGQGPKVPFLAIAGGSEFVCGILESGKLSCWGSQSMEAPADFSAF